MKYIITLDIPIGNPENGLIYVLTPEQIDKYQSSGFRYRERIYKLTSDNQTYEIVCAEIWKKDDIEHSVVIPAFLIPRRPYSLDVYVYAINLYSGEPKISQRTAAEATKKKFKLKTFSYTTIGRAIKKLSGALEEYSVAGISSDTSVAANMDNTTDITANTDTNGVAATVRGAMAETEADNSVDGIEYKKRFPTVNDTKKRRELISEFFKSKLNIKIRQGFLKACEQIAEWWYTRFNKLLI